MNTFLKLFQKANLTENETQYFLEDAQNAKTLCYPSLKEYYGNKETQFCLVNYALPEWQEIAKSGLSKIINVL